MNNQRSLLTNKPIQEQILKKSEQLFGKNDSPIFGVVSDLNISGKYDCPVMLVSPKKIIVFKNESNADSVNEFCFSQFKKAEVKRMYGNAVFKIYDSENKRTDVFRFTYSCADICDSIAGYINSIIDGEDGELKYEAAALTYKNIRCFCPKCGRKLSSPDADCLNCAGKTKIISKLTKYILPEKNRLIFSLILAIISTGMALAPPYVLKIMVDNVLPNRNMKLLIYAIGALLCIYIVQFTLGGIRSYIMRISGDKMILALKRDIYEMSQFLPMSFYDKTSTGSIINRVNSDTTILQNFMLRITQEAVVQLLMLVGIIIIMFSMDWQLTLLSLIPVPFVIVISKYFGNKIAPMYRRLWRRSTAISSLLADTIPGVRVIKSFSGEERAVRKFSRYTDELLGETKRALKTATTFPNIITFLITSGSLIIWGVGGNWVINMPGRLTVGLLVSFISYAGMFYTPVNFFASLNDSYQNALASAEKILDIINAEPESDFGKGNAIDSIKGKIEFRNVNFSFDRAKKVLTNVNFTINPGDIVGIVGTTGSGKSTLINLLLRFYDSYEGEILVDDKDIKQIDLGEYRKRIGYVQQEPLMFRDTVLNNLAYSKPNAHIEEIIHAADIANAHGFISKLTDSYDTMLGERGVGLSGGEKQRLSIARAVLKNPNILVFDEATSAVDSETEKLIQEAIERIIRGRTTLMIAHRLSTLRKANRILVVDKGEIIENGSHDELMALKGKYYKLIQIQSMSERVSAEKEAENFE